MLRAIRGVLLLVAISGLLVITPRPSFACFCVPVSSPAEELAKSSAVFSGRVVNVEASPASLWRDVESVNVTFQVSGLWKGHVGDSVTVLTARRGIDCGYEFNVGEEYLVYALGADNRLVVWLCSRTQPLAAANEDLAALGAASIPIVEGSNEVGIEVHASSSIAGQRETSQSFTYFVPWEWLKEGDELSEERVGFAFWNDPDKAPIVSSLRWHGAVYGGLVKKGVKLVLIEKIGNHARMTGPWEFGGDQHFRISVDDRPVVAEMVESQVTIRVAPAGDVTKYNVREGDTLGGIARTFDTTVAAIARANNVVDADLIFAGQILVIPGTTPAGGG